MKFAMIGTGGIGGFYAARLLAAGHQVTLVARGAQLQALTASGLTLSHAGDTLHFAAPDCCDTGTLFSERNSADYDLIILAVKSAATATLAAQLQAWYERCGQAVPVISFQNGVDNEQQLAERLGSDYVLGALLVGIGAHLTAPGHIESTGPGRVVLGAWPDKQQTSDGPATALPGTLTALFNAAGFPAEESDDIRRELWRKLVLNNGVNPLSALTGLDTRRLTTGEPFEPVALGLMREAVAAARADGVELEPDTAEQVLQFMQGFDAIKTSMLVDKENGRPLEIDAISGAVLARATRLGIDVPYTRTIHSLLTLTQRAP
ncbi:ketopantoate reductase family protein [Granulosicoccaceae sp. 1_MG-2023]|nr:ketopantoate reductase family protein [Granulosicoccaceae sp. 1_MG-2023]